MRKLSSELCAALTELPSCRVDELRRELIHKYHMELVNKDVGMLAFPLRGTRLSMHVVVRFHRYRLDDAYAKGTICISLGKV